MRNYKKFLVWKKSHQLTLDVYKNAISFPKDESFDLISQIKRSSSSIPTNICGRNQIRIFASFFILLLDLLINYNTKLLSID